MCFKLGEIKYCSIHKNTQLSTAICKACSGNGCQLCNNKGRELYCPTCREENVSKFKYFGWKR